MGIDDCVFCEIIAKRRSSRIEYEDEELAVLWDINPQAPTHLLFVPKKHIAKLSEFEETDIHLLGKMIMVAKKLAKRLNLNEKGFRIVINEGRDSGQSIFHIHMHLLSGRRMMWPPG